MPRAMKNVNETKIAHRAVVGWGADLPAENRPGIPKELNSNNVLSPRHHEVIRAKMKPDGSVNLTLERGSMTPIYGATVPAMPLSTPIRKLAFQYSEDSLRHWMLLLFADRVNMVEGWVEDIAHGKMPMLLPRMEFRTTDHLRRIANQGPKGKQDKILLGATVAVGVGLLGLAYAVASKRRPAKNA